MPKKAATKTAEPGEAPKARKSTRDLQGHRDGDSDYVPDRDTYDPARHANHSHLDP